MSNYNVLADLIAGHTDKARIQAERIMRAASVKAHAQIAEHAAKQAEPQQGLSKAEIKQLCDEAKAQARQLSADLTAQAEQMAADLRAQASRHAGESDAKA
ncbi:hypothetical protein [Nocardia concava]|uniref:hypothetical protein n=1 Tax=Nocardia concava TaxID=257281 RepID=UPI0003087A5A|nr:hypothetical protein [Nocardia concava]